MTIRINYLNGCWECLHNVKAISSNEHYFLLELKNGSIKKYDSRLRLEVFFDKYFISPMGDV